MRTTVKPTRPGGAIVKRLGVAVTILALTISGLGAPPRAWAASRDIDNGSLESVRDAYLTWLWPALKSPRDWSGDPTKCVAGSPQAQPEAAVGTYSSAGQAASLEAVNYFREMAGLAPVTESPAASALARQAALIMQANDLLTHYPDASMKCFSADGYLGASTSNLALGLSGAKAVAGLVDDHGPNNREVGHRRWLLYPPLSSVGLGSTYAAASTVVQGAASARDNVRPSGGTAWPSAGYLPWEIAPTSNRWSYTLPAGDFTSATVSMTRNGVPWDAWVVTRGGVFGDPALVWETGGLPEPAIGAVDVYGVTLSGVADAPVSYQVRVFRAGVTSVGAVTIEGEVVAGSAVTARASGVTPSDAFLDYRWYADGEEVGDSATYDIGTADAGRTLVVKVSANTLFDNWATGPATPSAAVRVPAVATGGQESEPESNPASPAPSKKLTKTPVPKVTGTAKVGKTLTARPGTWKPAGVKLAYQWYRSGSAVAGATASRYVVQPADKGKKVSVKVTGSKPGYFPATRSSKATKKVAAGTLTAATPKVTGKARIGISLTANPGVWKPTGVALAYQWYRSGRKIPGATAATHVPTASDAGKKLTVRVTGVAAGYASTSRTSKKTAKVATG